MYNGWRLTIFVILVADCVSCAGDKEPIYRVADGPSRDFEVAEVSGWLSAEATAKLAGFTNETSATKVKSMKLSFPEEFYSVMYGPFNETTFLPMGDTVVRLATVKTRGREVRLTFAPVPKEELPEGVFRQRNSWVVPLNGRASLHEVRVEYRRHSDHAVEIHLTDWSLRKPQHRDVRLRLKDELRFGKLKCVLLAIVPPDKDKKIDGWLEFSFPIRRRADPTLPST